MNGEMVLVTGGSGYIGGWCVAGLLDAERHFNRVKGYRHLKLLLDALQHDVEGPTLDAQRKRA